MPFGFINRTAFSAGGAFRADTVDATFRSIIDNSALDPQGRRQGWRIGYDSTGTHFERWIDNVVTKASAAAPVVGTSYRVIGSYDGTVTKIWRNGTPTTGGSSTVSLKDSGGQFIIGNLLDGKIGPLPFVVESVLSDSSVTNLENAANAYDNILPTTPSSLVATNPIGNTVQLSWTAIEGYDFNYYVVEELISSVWTRRKMTIRREATFIDLITNSVHRYRIRSIDDYGNESTPSNESEITVAGSITNPAPVTSVEVRTGDGQLTIDWPDSSDPERSGYRVYQRNANGTYPTTPTFTPTSSTQVVTGLTNNVTYTFRVTVVRVTGSESLPVEVSGTPRPLVVGINGVAVVNGRLTLTGIEERFIIRRDQQLLTNSRATASYGNTGAPSLSDRHGLVVKRISDGSTLYMYVNSQSIALISFEAGIHNVLSSLVLNVPQQSNVTYWLTASLSDGVFTASHYLQRPIVSIASTTITTTLSTARKALYSQEGPQGLYMRGIDPGWQTMWMDDFSVDSVIGSSLSIVSRNNGNFRAHPVITITGPVSNPVLSNLANGQTIRITGQILVGEKIIIDTAERTILDGAGVSKFTMLDLSSDWMEIEPGENIILITVGSSTNQSNISFDVHDSWM